MHQFAAEGRDPVLLKFQLEAQGFFVFSVSVDDGGGTIFSGLSKFMGSGFGIRDLVRLSRQLSVMLKSGLSLTRAIETLSSQPSGGGLRDVLRAVVSEIRSGRSLSYALSKFPEIFPVLFVQTVHAGEMSGSLAEVLNRLSAHYERSRKLRATLMQAMIYPSVLLLLSMAILGYLVVGVLPKFSDIFFQMGSEMPIYTQVVLGLSDFLRSRLALLALVVFAMVYEFRAWHASLTGRLRFDSFLLGIPLLGDLILKFTVSNMSRTLATLIAGGLPLVESFRVVVSSVENQSLYRAFARAVPVLEGGGAFSVAAEETGVMPEMALSMMRAGEESGSLSVMLSNMADYYDDEVSEKSMALAALAEPILMLGTALCAGLLVLSIFLPVLQMSMSVKF